MKEKSKKKQYSAPVISVFSIEMEHGIAAASATVKVGTETNENTPSLEDWKSEGTYVDDIFM